jgi:hypothetical protein
MKIYSIENLNRVQWETLYKGKGNWCDLVVESEGYYYPVAVYDMVRLQKDFKFQVNRYGYYQADPNIVIVKEFTFNEVKFTLENLEIARYFERIMPIQKPDFTILQELI